MSKIRSLGSGGGGMGAILTLTGDIGKPLVLFLLSLEYFKKGKTNENFS